MGDSGVRVGHEDVVTGLGDLVCCPLAASDEAMEDLLQISISCRPNPHGIVAYTTWYVQNAHMMVTGLAC